MSIAEKNRTEETEKIEKTIQPNFPNVEAYRYNSASIRVRVIDGRFQNKSKSERHEMVYPLLKDLPEEILSDVTILLLLTPEELDTSPMNVEFEHPSPSRL
jgi:stress-induced morphogen